LPYQSEQIVEDLDFPVAVRPGTDAECRDREPARNLRGDDRWNQFENDCKSAGGFESFRVLHTKLRVTGFEISER
jgi:hypothetical protein